MVTQTSAGLAYTGSEWGKMRESLSHWVAWNRVSYCELLYKWVIVSHKFLFMYIAKICVSVIMRKTRITISNRARTHLITNSISEKVSLFVEHMWDPSYEWNTKNNVSQNVFILALYFLFNRRIDATPGWTWNKSGKSCYIVIHKGHISREADTVPLWNHEWTELISQCGKFRL